MSLKSVNYKEPAALRGAVLAVAGLLAALGVVLPSDLPERVDAVILGAFTLLPLVQAAWTRASVWSPKAKDDAVLEASPHRVIPQTPGVGDHRAPE